MRALVIVPTYNEFENLGRLVPAVRGRLPPICWWWMMPPPTAPVIWPTGWRASMPGAFTCSTGRASGGWAPPTSTASAGAAARFQFLMEMDCDFSHRRICRVCFQRRRRRMWCSGRAGRRYPGWPGRRLLNRGGSAYAGVCWVFRITISPAAKCFARAQAQSLRHPSTGYGFKSR